MLEINEEITDQLSYVHKLDEKLGQGGQGIVYRTKDPDLAIKFVIDSEGQPLENSEEIKSYIQKIKQIKYLPISSDINISLPVALLQDKAGYIMKLLTEMIPFETFWGDGQSISKLTINDIPSWLEGMPEESAKHIVHYYKTGGLKRRLLALQKCSTELAKIHASGLVYGDISPGNIFISEKTSNIKVWFIDPDNIRFDIPNFKGGVFTPKYGAPELVQGISGGSFRSDCHAFATLAFYMLSMVHPFIGDQVLDNDIGWEETEVDEDDIDEKAYAGFLPWVDDKENDSNQNNSGLPRMLLLTKELTNLFDKTFSDGRVDFWKRPAIYHWPEALAQAHDKTLTCPACSMSYYHDIETDSCPYCSSKKPSYLIFNTYKYDNENKLSTPLWSCVKEVDETIEFELPSRIFNLFKIGTNEDTYLKIKLDEYFMHIHKNENIKDDIYLATQDINNGKFIKLISKNNLDKKAIDNTIYIYVDSDYPMIVECKYGNIL